jgi:thioredoxin-like negative regulator of GroEL
VETSLIATLGLLLIAIIGGILYKYLQGKGRRVLSAEVIDLAKLRASSNEVPITEYGKKATLIQFSTQYCGQCPGVRRTLSQLAYRTGGLAFAEVDITERLDVAAHFSISQTPTVFLLNDSGHVIYRVGGIPKMNLLTEQLQKLGVK